LLVELNEINTTLFFAWFSGMLISSNPDRRITYMVKRELYLKRIRPFFDSEMVKVITGIRRCGKSTIIKQIIQELSDKDVSDGRIIYINFEDYQYRDLCDADTLFTFVEKRIVGDGKYYLLFDEIQNVSQFELVINSFRSTHDVSIFITGSNSRLLSGELATHLSGRTLSFRIMPFTFYEYCEYQDEIHSDKTKEELLDEYMKWGGFPLVCKESEETSKEIILSNIYDSVVLKDIIMRNKVASPLALEKVMNYVVGNSSITFSGNKVALSLSDNNQSVSAPTVYDYLKYMEDACICDKVSRYDIRGKKVLAFEEKIYICDLGFFHLKKNRVKDEYNYIVETICYNELVARGYKVYIGKTFKGEVDFIAEKGKEKFYVQAAYLLSDEKVIEREFGAYNGISDHYPKYVITLDRTILTRDGIIHLNLIDFLLDHK